MTDLKGTKDLMIPWTRLMLRQVAARTSGRVGRADLADEVGQAEHAVDAVRLVVLA